MLDTDFFFGFVHARLQIAKVNVYYERYDIKVVFTLTSYAVQTTVTKVLTNATR